MLKSVNKGCDSLISGELNALTLRAYCTRSQWFVHAQKKIYRHIETVDLAIHMSCCSTNQGWGSGKGVIIMIKLS